MNQESHPVRILVAEDEPALRRSICRAVRSVPEFRLAGDLASGREAVNFVRRNPVDIVLMDIEMESNNDGLAAAEAIYEIDPRVAVIVLTVHEDENTIYRAYCVSSVRDYVIKSGSNDEVISALRRVHQMRLQADSANDKLRHEFRRLKRNEESLIMAIDLLSRLTPSEKGILRLKLDGCSNRQIAEKRAVEEGTIKSQIGGMLKKLGYKKSSQVTELIRQLRLEQFFE